MLPIDFAKTTDTTAALLTRQWSGQFWYTTMSVNIPENTDVMVVRYATRFENTFPTDITLNHITTGSYMRKRAEQGDGNVHGASIWDIVTPPSGPTKLYIRAVVDPMTDRIVVDYLRNVNIKVDGETYPTASVSSFGNTSSISFSTSPGDLLLDLIMGPNTMTASADQTVQLYSQDSPTTAKWYAASYQYATGSTTTMRWDIEPPTTRTHLVIAYKPSPGGRIDVISEGQNQIIVSSNPSEGNLITVV